MSSGSQQREDNDSANRPGMGVVATTVTIVGSLVVFSAFATLLASRFPSQAMWIIGGLAVLYCAGIGIWMGLDWRRPYMKPEDRRYVKLIGLGMPAAVFLLVLFDALKNGFDIIVSVGVLFAACFGCVTAGFLIGQRTGRQRNSTEER